MFFNDQATTEIYTLSLHDALPVFAHVSDDEDAFELASGQRRADGGRARREHERVVAQLALLAAFVDAHDRLRRKNLQRFGVQPHVYSVSLTEIFGRVKY